MVPTFQRGEILLSQFPFTDLTGASVRPAVVVSQGMIGNDLILAGASAYRSVAAPEHRQLEIWAETLALGAALPTLPLWIAPELSIAIDLEQAYEAACAARRIG